MSRLSIATFTDAREVSLGVPSQVLTVAIAGSTAQSSAITGVTGAIMYVRLSPDADCDYEVGADPAAVAGTSRFLGSGAIEYIGVLVGHKIAVIAHA